MAELQGYEIKENTGGGDCMFLSLSDQLYHRHNLEINARELRNCVVHHLREIPKTVSCSDKMSFQKDPMTI